MFASTAAWIAISSAATSFDMQAIRRSCRIWAALAEAAAATGSNGFDAAGGGGLGADQGQGEREGEGVPRHAALQALGSN